MRRSKKTLSWRIMERYSAMKLEKGSGKSIIATARKLSRIIWCMLTEEVPFDPSLMVDNRLNRKASSMKARFQETA